MLAGSLGLGLLVLITAPAYAAAARAVAGGIKALAAAAEPVALSVQFLTGPPDRLDTIGGYLSYKVFGSCVLLLAIYAAIQGAQLMRGPESKGLFDLWYAAGRTRNAIIRDRICAFIVALGVIVAGVYVGTVVGGALSGVQLESSAIGQCLAAGLLALWGFAFALLASQFLKTARAAAATASAYLVASYFVANTSGSLGAAAFLRFVSPFFYYLQNRTLVPQTEPNVAAMAIILITAVALSAAAWFLYLRRDIGGVSVSRIRHQRVVNRKFSPSLLWRRSLWLNWIAEQPVAITSWMLGIGAFTALEASLVPEVTRVLTSDTTLKRVMQTHPGLFSSDQLLSALMSFTPVLAAAFVVTQVGRWADDASQHRTDVVLSFPVSMERFLVERAVALVAMSTLIGLAAAAGAWSGATVGGYSTSTAGLARTVFDVVVLSFGIGGIGLVTTAYWRSGVATGITAGLLIASFFLTTIAGLLTWPSWTSRPSLFDAFGTPYLSMPRPWSLTYLIVLGLAGLAAAYLVMRQGRRISV
ncbi:MAG TPA: hypothetical protein VNI34_09145 [Candidatus Nitrosotalea sp.]|nr:hypothetical protein [Candidatus Nitrosotalea sp.]